MTGETGAPGAAGAAIVARPETTAAFDTTTTLSAITLGSNTWTQTADEIDMFVGSIRLADSTCVPPSGAASQLLLFYEDAGNEFGMQSVIGPHFVVTTVPLPDVNLQQGAASGNAYVSSYAIPILLDPGTDTARSLGLKMRDNCTTGHIHVESIKLRVVRFL